MSESNKALCWRFIEEVWNRRQLSVVDELFAPNYTEDNPNGPDFGRGPDGVRKMLGYYLTAFPDAQFTIEDLITEGDFCAIRWTARGTH
ncbi:MAG TPA: ester cyclase, partial [Bryobacteraceae bacterium]|nr:ester cyclase [Bryobacteraceae bacterium]